MKCIVDGFLRFIRRAYECSLDETVVRHGFCDADAEVSLVRSDEDSTTSIWELEQGAQEQLDIRRTRRRHVINVIAVLV